MTATQRRCTGCGTPLSRYNQAGLCGPCQRARVQPQPVTAERGEWLFTPGHRSAPPDASDLGVLLREWRTARKVPQRQLAHMLGFTQPYISMLETGSEKIRDLGTLRHIAATLAIPPEELGLLPDTIADGQHAVASNDDVTPDVAAAQRSWKHTRQYLDEHRTALSRVAAALYTDAVRAGGSSVITRPAWMAPEPVELADIGLEWRLDAAPAQLNGTEPEAAATRPPNTAGKPYDRYSRAMRDIARPRLFENRPGYRLLDVDWSAKRPRLSFAYTSYFESVIDVSTALGHELAAASLAASKRADSVAEPAWSAMPYRALVGDPFDLARRPVLPSFDTLTIRHDPRGSSFLLHRRDARLVATASSLYHVMPAGVFQPSSIAPWHQANDFDLWHALVREFAEEFLDEPEADGSSPNPIDYRGTEPFRSLCEARDAGAFHVYFFGIGLDPITLCGEMLSVAVIDADAFDQLFANLVTVNQEGDLVTADRSIPAGGIPFTEDAIRRLLDHEPLAAPAAACLRLAWRHRTLLLPSAQ
jgi:transcriptional regulator with XRE-family HTH domain